MPKGRKKKLKEKKDRNKRQQIKLLQKICIDSLSWEKPYAWDTGEIYLPFTTKLHVNGTAYPIQGNIELVGKRRDIFLVTAKFYPIIKALWGSELGLKEEDDICYKIDAERRQKYRIFLRNKILKLIEENKEEIAIRKREALESIRRKNLAPVSIQVPDLVPELCL